MCSAIPFHPIFLPLEFMTSSLLPFSFISANIGREPGRMVTGFLDVSGKVEQRRKQSEKIKNKIKEKRSQVYVSIFFFLFRLLPASYQVLCRPIAPWCAFMVL